jgi:hypothetical protein
MKPGDNHKVGWSLLKGNWRPADPFCFKSDTHPDAVGDLDKGIPLFIPYSLRVWVPPDETVVLSG